MAFYPTVTIGADSYVGLELGNYIFSTSTADEPITLEIAKPAIKPAGRSYASLHYTTVENSASLGAQDVQHDTRVTFKWDSGCTAADLRNQLVQLHAFATEANIARLMRGER